jgi:CHAT domain-containing protein
MDADVLIEYLRCDDAFLALLASRDGDCRSAWLGAADALLDLHDELYLSFQNVLLHPDGLTQHMQIWLDECRPLLRRCYELLLAPLGRLPMGAHLLIAPCDSLYLFPFAAFWDGQQYLVERHEIQMTPSGALLAAPAPAQTTAAPLIVAASGVRRLAAVMVETAAVQAALPESVCLIDDPQTVDYLRGLQAPPRILHIAAHSVVREDAPIFSALQLSGAHLSVEQCFELPLRGTELVVLSGCTTGGGLDSGGALLAFQSAFFAAGARQVLSSLWPIEDSAAAAWMARFYRFLAVGLPPPAALRQTQRALLADPASEHPAIWAAFTCSRR